MSGNGHSEHLESAVRFGMVIDLDKCTGCGACSVACQQENNIAFRPDESNKLRTLSWMTLYRLENGQDYPDHRLAYLPRPCMHCDSGHDAPCTFVCPVNATKRDETTGFVNHIPVRCIGCRYCMVACPYHARSFNWWDPKWPETMEAMLNPEVSPRMRGVVEKCTFCHQRYYRARDAARAAGEDPNTALYTPACAEACPTGAIVFGNLKDPHSEVAELSKDSRAFRLLAKLHTEPKVIYLSRHAWVHKQSDNGL
ncbi:MAG: menaquinone reductase iron-sulfur cluster-binding subunit QrcC [Thermodesulfobacteriota bacterium]|nr:menaquinone reductase iron-sulfur cluster-binding subunit QrcC [Thermodesulfobacteriota bacterium]